MPPESAAARCASARARPRALLCSSCCVSAAAPAPADAAAAFSVVSASSTPCCVGEEVPAAFRAAPAPAAALERCSADGRRGRDDPGRRDDFGGMLAAGANNQSKPRVRAHTRGRRRKQQRWREARGESCNTRMQCIITVDSHPFLISVLIMADAPLHPPMLSKTFVGFVSVHVRRM